MTWIKSFLSYNPFHTAYFIYFIFSRVNNFFFVVSRHFLWKKFCWPTFHHRWEVIFFIVSKKINVAIIMTHIFTRMKGWKHWEWHQRECLFQYICFAKTRSLLSLKLLSIMWYFILIYFQLLCAGRGVGFGGYLCLFLLIDNRNPGPSD